MRTRLTLAALGVLMLASCHPEEGERDAPPIFSKTSHPQIAVSVTSDMFVTSGQPLLTDIGGAYLVRLELTPAGFYGEANALADVCRAGGSAVVTVKDSSIPPFIVTEVTDHGDALVLCNTRERAVEILRALRFEEKDFDGYKPRDFDGDKPHK